MTTSPSAKGPAYLPGDPPPRQRRARMIRVDHAGEYGAVRIYEGQLSVLDHGRAALSIREMAAKEREHLETFERLIVEHGVRPTVLGPVWHALGFALGAATALLGEKAAMACTVAVEETIDAHYARQAERLAEDGEAELGAIVERFREDELEHRAAALDRGAEDAPLYPLLTGMIKAGSRLAIWLSERF